MISRDENMEITLIFRTPGRGETARFRRHPAALTNRENRAQAKVIKAAGYKDSVNGWVSYDPGAAARIVAAFETAGYAVHLDGAVPAELEPIAA
jgi:hypothetical protein